MLIFQPSLAAYRVPVYKLLNERCGMQVEVAHALSDSIQSVDPDGFRSRVIRSHRMPIFGRKVTLTPDLLRRQPDPDVLVLSWNANEALLLPALRRWSRRGAGTILWGHGYSQSDASWRTMLRNRLARSADALLTYDEATAGRLRQLPSLPPVFTASNTIDTAPMLEARRWWEEGTRLADFQRREDIEAAAVLLNVGRLTPQRHLEVLLRAAGHLADGGQPTQLVIVGSGPERMRLETCAADLGLSVRFIPGTYDEHELAPWFLSATTFVAPSHLGLAVFHAFAYGLPVLTGNNLSVHPPEVHALRHEGNGLFFAHDDPAALASAIRRVIRNPGLREAMSREATRTISEDYTIEHMVDGFEEAIRYVVSLRR